MKAPELIQMAGDADLSRLLMMLVDINDFEVGKHIPRKIPVDRCLTMPPYRDNVEALAGLYREGVKLPPIQVVKLVIAWEAFYAISDGNHRIHASRLANLRYIWAYVDCTHCIPSLEPYRIWNGMLWQKDGPRYRSHGYVLKEPEIRLLAALGIKVVEYIGR